ncbi:MAG: sulfotransferase [Parvibaculaceae bacterium]
MAQNTASRSPQDTLRTAFQLFDQGKLREALQMAQGLRKDHPTHPDVLHLLGLICLRGGDPEQAEKFIRLAISVLPDAAFFHVNLANALRQQGRRDDALAAYNRAEELDATFAGTYVNRGTLHAEEGRAEEAIADFEKAIRCAPDQPEGYLRLGTFLSAEGDFQRARSTYERGLDVRPDGPALLLGLAGALERLGDLDAALAATERVLEAQPGMPAAVRLWATCKRRQGKLEEARDRLERIEIAKLPAPMQRALHAELGQVYDRLNETAVAFDHFTAQNKAAAETLEPAGIDKASYMDQVRALAAAFTPEWVASWRQIDADALTPVPAPVFLVGFPRSGTTLLDQFLNAHDAIDVIEERPILLPLRDALQAEGGYPQALADLTPERANALRALYAEGMAREGIEPTSPRTVINKLPLNIIHAGLIARVFPEAKFILSLRHPADAVLSCFMQDFQLNASMAHFLTLKDSVALYDAVMSLWRQYRSLLPLSVSHVRYEDLIRDPQTALAETLAQLGLDWQEGQRDHAAHAASRGTIRTPSYSQVTEPLYDRAAQRWRRYETHLEGILPRLEPYMAEFGYD